MNHCIAFLMATMLSQVITDPIKDYQESKPTFRGSNGDVKELYLLHADINADSNKDLLMSDNMFFAAEDWYNELNPQNPKYLWIGYIATPEGWLFCDGVAQFTLNGAYIGQLPGWENTELFVAQAWRGGDIINAITFKNGSIEKPLVREYIKGQTKSYNAPESDDFWNEFFKKNKAVITTMPIKPYRVGSNEENSDLSEKSEGVLDKATVDPELNSAATSTVVTPSNAANQAVTEAASTAEASRNTIEEKESAVPETSDAPFPLTISAEYISRVSITTNPPDLSNPYPACTEVTLTVSPPDPDTEIFDHWRVNDVDMPGSSNELTLVMNESKDVDLVFRRCCGIEVQANSGGTTSPSPGTYYGFEGETLSISAIPEQCKQLKRWTGAGETVNGARKVTYVYPACTTAAEFEDKESTVIIRTYYENLSTPAGVGVKIFDGIAADVNPIGETDANGVLVRHIDGLLAINDTGEHDYTAIVPGIVGGTVHIRPAAGYSNPTCEDATVKIVMMGGGITRFFVLDSPEFQQEPWHTNRILSKDFKSLSFYFTDPKYHNVRVPLGQVDSVTLTLNNRRQRIEAGSLFSLQPDGYTVKVKDVAALREVLLALPGEITVGIHAQAASGLFVCSHTTEPFRMGRYRLDVLLDAPGITDTSQKDLLLTGQGNGMGQGAMLYLSSEDWPGALFTTNPVGCRATFTDLPEGDVKLWTSAYQTSSSPSVSMKGSASFRLRGDMSVTLNLLSPQEYRERSVIINPTR